MRAMRSERSVDETHVLPCTTICDRSVPSCLHGTSLDRNERGAHRGRHAGLESCKFGRTLSRSNILYEANSVLILLSIG